MITVIRRTLEVAREQVVLFRKFPHDIIRFIRGLSANGAIAVEHKLSLPRNAIVESRFYATIIARQADWTEIANVAHTRARDISGADQPRTSVVVDFGTMRTVAGVGLASTEKFQVLQVKAWAGTGFAQAPVVSGAARATLVINGGGGAPTTIDSSTPKLSSTFFEAAVPFPSEVKTERLQIDLIGAGTEAELGQTVLVHLPDPPADFDLKINGGAPIWSSAGALPATGTGDLHGWTSISDKKYSQTTDITAAVNSFIADPAASRDQKVELQVVLGARVGGALQLDLTDPAAATIRFLAKSAPDTTTVAFTEEGVNHVPLALPSYATKIARVRFTAIASLPPERTVPPVGPEPATLADGTTPLAELRLDATHAACVGLVHARDFAELVALRFPFVVGADGAEAHVALLETGDDGDPGKPIEGGVSKPIQLAASGVESWTTFALPRPVPIHAQPGLPDPLTAGRPALYAAILVTRGQVRWALGADDAKAGGRVFTGAATGPWEIVPPLGERASLSGRVRITAHAAPETPVAPLIFAVESASASGLEKTPTAKGVAAEISGADAEVAAAPAGGGQKQRIRITSRVAGSVTLRDIVVTVDAPLPPG